VATCHPVRYVTISLSMPERPPDNSEFNVEPSVEGFFIPADIGDPIERTSVPLNDYRARQELVGGLFTVLDFIEPPATLYCGDEAILQGRAPNARASLLLSMHNFVHRNYTVIFGDGFLVGPADDDGNDTPVPEELTRMLTDPAPKVVGAKVDGNWVTRGKLYPSWIDAYSSALRLARAIPDIQDVRVTFA